MLSATQVTSDPKELETRRQNQGSFELASVCLELNSRVEGTWDNPEPEAYITDLRGDVLVRGEDEEADACVGTISAFYVQLENAGDDGIPWSDVLDAHSGHVNLGGERSF